MWLLQEAKIQKTEEKRRCIKGKQQSSHAGDNMQLGNSFGKENSKGELSKGHAVIHRRV